MSLIFRYGFFCARVVEFHGERRFTRHAMADASFFLTVAIFSLQRIFHAYIAVYKTAHVFAISQAARRQQGKAMVATLHAALAPA